MKAPIRKADARVLRAAIAELKMNQTQFAASIEWSDRQVRRMCASEAAVPKLVWMAIELLTIKMSAASAMDILQGDPEL